MRANGHAARRKGSTLYALSPSLPAKSDRVVLRQDATWWRVRQDQRRRSPDALPALPGSLGTTLARLQAAAAAYPPGHPTRRRLLDTIYTLRRAAETTHAKGESRMTNATTNRRAFLKGSLLMPAAMLLQPPHPPGHQKDEVLDEVAREIGRTFTAIRRGVNPRDPEHLRHLAGQLRIAAAGVAKYDAAAKTTMRRAAPTADFDLSTMKDHLSEYIDAADLAGLEFPVVSAAQITAMQNRIRVQGLSPVFREGARMLDIVAARTATVNNPQPQLVSRVRPIQLGDCQMLKDMVVWYDIMAASICAASIFAPWLAEACAVATAAWAGTYAYFWWKGC